MKMASVSLEKHVWTSMNANLARTTATKMPNVAYADENRNTWDSIGSGRAERSEKSTKGSF